MPIWDPDLSTYTDQFHSIRKDLVDRLRELHRRWSPVSSRLRHFQTAEIKYVTSTRDLGFLALLVVLWHGQTPHCLVISFWG